jgi:hypothetical protein
MSPRESKETLEWLLKSYEPGEKVYKAIEQAICYIEEGFAKSEKENRSPGRPCWYRERRLHENRTEYIVSDWSRGHFLQWSEDSDEYGGVYPCAIVEYHDGSVSSVPVKDINFSHEKPL